MVSRPNQMNLDDKEAMLESWSLILLCYFCYSLDDMIHGQPSSHLKVSVSNKRLASRDLTIFDYF